MNRSGNHEGTRLRRHTVAAALWQLLQSCFMFPKRQHSAIQRNNRWALYWQPRYPVLGTLALCCKGKGYNMTWYCGTYVLKMARTRMPHFRLPNCRLHSKQLLSYYKASTATANKACRLRTFGGGSDVLLHCIKTVLQTWSYLL